ncbi:MAG: hypothetical protein L0027_16760 [Candidatus Rokubacteria bacterium]|nr:hypothetical protein [Candidatus Rokubacteria bacterium]
MPTRDPTRPRAATPRPRRGATLPSPERQLAAQARARQRFKEDLAKSRPLDRAIAALFRTGVVTLDAFEDITQRLVHRRPVTTLERQVLRWILTMWALGERERLRRPRLGLGLEYRVRRPLSTADRDVLREVFAARAAGVETVNGIQRRLLAAGVLPKPTARQVFARRLARLLAGLPQ